MKKISIILLVILCVGCRTIKTVEQTQETKKDSVSYIERVKIDTLRIPAEKIQIELPCNQLRPQSSAQGRAKVKAEPRGNGYIVVLSCDSIEKIVISKDREINRLSQALQISDSKKTKELTFMQTAWIKIGKCLTFVLALWGVIILLVKWKVLR
jgi:hypothetical protein